MYNEYSMYTVSIYIYIYICIYLWSFNMPLLSFIDGNGSELVWNSNNFPPVAESLSLTESSDFPVPTVQKPFVLMQSKLQYSIWAVDKYLYKSIRHWTDWFREILTIAWNETPLSSYSIIHKLNNKEPFYTAKLETWVEHQVLLWSSQIDLETSVSFKNCRHSDWETVKPCYTYILFVLINKSKASFHRKLP